MDRIFISNQKHFQHYETEQFSPNFQMTFCKVCILKLLMFTKNLSNKQTTTTTYAQPQKNAKTRKEVVTQKKMQHALQYN